MTPTLKAAGARGLLLSFFVASLLMPGCGSDLPGPVEISCATLKRGELTGTRTGWHGGCPSGCQRSCGSAVSVGSEIAYLFLDISCQQGEADFDIQAPDETRLWSKTHGAYQASDRSSIWKEVTGNES